MDSSISREYTAPIVSFSTEYGLIEARRLCVMSVVLECVRSQEAVALQSPASRVLAQSIAEASYASGRAVLI